MVLYMPGVAQAVGAPVAVRNWSGGRGLLTAAAVIGLVDFTVWQRKARVTSESHPSHADDITFGRRWKARGGCGRARGAHVTGTDTVTSALHGLARSGDRYLLCSDV